MFRCVVPVFLVLSLAVAIPTSADEAARLDFGQFERIPVFDAGRRMPLDTFARSVVSKICGRTRPRLDPPTAPLSDPLRALFPDGERRRFGSSELLLSWILQPQHWEDVPLLIARHQALREEFLEVPMTDELGHRLKHISPQQFEDSPLFQSRARAVAGKDRRDWAERVQRYKELGIEKEVSNLFSAHALYRQLTFDPRRISENRQEMRARITPLLRAWAPLEGRLRQLPQGDLEQGSRGPIDEVAEAVKQVRELQSQESFELAEVDAVLAQVRRSANELARRVHQACRQAFEDSTLSPAERAVYNELAAKTSDLAALADQMHLALYDNGRSLRLVPALNAAALKVGRESGDPSQPWLNLQTLRFGSAALLSDYPQSDLAEARRAFDRLSSIYLDRSAADRPGQLTDAMQQWAAALRKFGERIEPIRRKLPIQGDREDVVEVLRQTAYPPEGFVDTELRYNRADPILWSWVTCLLATVGFVLAFGRLRKPMFWLGIVTICVAQGVILYGLSLRAMITGWVPVTNMFETIIFVGLTSAMMGTWFTLSPMLNPGIIAAWRMTALPDRISYWLYGRWRGLPRKRGTIDGKKAPAGTMGQESDVSPQPATAEISPTLQAAKWILLLPRIGLMVWIFRALTIETYGSGSESPIVRLLPKGDLLPWVVGLSVAALAVSLGPRIIAAGVLAPGVLVGRWLRQGIGELHDEVLRRKLFATVGAAAGFLFCLLAYNWPVESQGMGGMKAVLRDNFWLTVHVLSITASYGAGALAWGMGNIALAYYLLGRYRAPAATSPTRVGRSPASRPPQACANLAAFAYRAIQVAVVLLAAGTILGALWADVAWGRFWGWDAKEVWSLISILTYSIVLHGRYIGWFGNFGMAVCAVLGATSIAMAWYGVNYVLGSGLHTYGGGSGSGSYVITLALCNWLLVAVAAVRYGLEIFRPPEQQQK